MLDGGYLNDVKRVYAEDAYYVLKYGNRTVAKKFSITLPDTRTRDEYSVVAAFRAKFREPGFIIRPVTLVDDTIAVFESAPLQAETLFQKLMSTAPSEALLATIIHDLARMHNATLDDPELRDRFAHNRGFLQVKIGVQCLQATGDRRLLTHIEKFVAASLDIKKSCCMVISHRKTLWCGPLNICLSTLRRADMEIRRWMPVISWPICAYTNASVAHRNGTGSLIAC